MTDDPLIPQRIRRRRHTTNANGAIDAGEAYQGHVVGILNNPTIEGRRDPPPAGDHARLFLFHQLRRKQVSPRARSWGTPRFIGLLGDAATVRGK